jgi:hypothetical protein
MNSGVRKRKRHFALIIGDTVDKPYQCSIEGDRPSHFVDRTDVPRISDGKRGRIQKYVSFRAAVKTDAGMAAAAHSDQSKDSAATTSINFTRKASSDIG